ncbi:expressed unknown protein [Seminavis robusta]|uniref:Uncharacterized protein n=1 Tax=Seminavis robusta TaxID=568900 RepID=A0A9N8HNX2_9STRA|nr:expressed unknown protein [Seminavis robusta]|eukprot:Sro1264_g257410.1 n/a (126) ;mRNA; f:28292-28669
MESTHKQGGSNEYCHGLVTPQIMFTANTNFPTEGIVAADNDNENDSPKGLVDASSKLIHEDDRMCEYLLASGGQSVLIMAITKRSDIKEIHGKLTSCMASCCRRAQKNSKNDILASLSSEGMAHG